MKKFIIQFTCTIGCLFLYSGYGYSAACAKNAKLNNRTEYIPDRTYTIQYDDSSTTVLDTITLTYGAAPLSVTANPSGCYNIGLRLLNSAPITDTTISTSISGITFTAETAGLTVRQPFSYWYSSASLVNIRSPSWIIKVQKTGYVRTGGTLDARTIGTLQGLGNENGVNTHWIWNLTTAKLPANTMKIIVLSCSLKNNQNTYNINMGDWYDTQFKNINDTQGTVDIPISLSCLSGTNIKVTVTSDNIDNAANGRLGLVGANSAKGIAVQLLNNAGSPITLNQQFTQQDGVTQTDYIFGWKARYIKTAATVTPGTANANATVNILYE
ncbi:fimbrial protein [Providencia sp. wls1943]|uniref:fimbrial protein n=1 Tax=Providencia sp. wls1943 TaxID=2675150 RepID=UPI0012B586A1|nr:fimbrial protein [Providencia sp. wls1943]MTB65508.1 fimbrial protein [Providencia sp. wls1943]